MTRDDPLHLARKSTGLGLADHAATPDMARMRNYRMARVQAELRRRDYAGAVLYDPINIRYATGSRNMAVWTMHNPARYAFVPAEGSSTTSAEVIAAAVAAAKPSAIGVENC